MNIQYTIQDGYLVPVPQIKPPFEGNYCGTYKNPEYQAKYRSYLDHLESLPPKIKCTDEFLESAKDHKPGRRYSESDFVVWPDFDVPPVGEYAGEVCAYPISSQPESNPDKQQEELWREFKGLYVREYVGKPHDSWDEFIGKVKERFTIQRKPTNKDV